MSEPDLEIALPSPSRAGWIFVLLVGLALAVLAGVEVAQGWRSLQRPIDLLGLGAGVFLAFFSIAVQASRPLPAMLTVGRRKLTVLCRNGETVAVPLTTIRSVETIDGASGGNTDVVALKKRDGGFIELCALRSTEAAEQIAAPIREAIERAADQDDEGGAAEPLRAVRSVSISRDGDSLQLSWRARSLAKSLAALGPLVGMAIIIYGFHLHDGGISTIIAIVFTAVLGLALVAATLLGVGVSQRLTIDDRQVVAERLRGARVTDQSKTPLPSVVTVDYAQALNVMGAGLTIRTATDDGAEPGEEEASSGPQGGRLTGSVMKLLSNGIHVSCFNLSLPAKIALALAVGDEVASRGARPAERPPRRSTG